MVRRDFLKSLLAGCSAFSALSIERMAAAFDEAEPSRWLRDGKQSVFPFELAMSGGKESRLCDHWLAGHFDEPQYEVKA